MLGLLFLVVMVYTGPAADPPQRLTPEQRKELERQATELSNAVVQHYQRGELGLALDKARQAMPIREQLYPESEFPQGHPDLASSLHDLGTLLREQGAYGEARGYSQRAVAMRQALYPGERYPQGHPDLAESLSQLGAVLHEQGAYGEARGISSGRWRCAKPSTPGRSIPRATPLWPLP